MSDPVIGNRASEMGQHELGVDFEDISSARIPERIADVPVRIIEDNSSIVVTPETRFRSDSPTKLNESPADLVKYGVFEDAAMERGGSREAVAASVVEGISKLVAAEMRLRVPSRNKLIYVQVNSTECICAYGSRVIVMRDAIESEYSCRACGGKGYTDIDCPRCSRSQVETIVNPEDVSQSVHAPCRQCRVLGFDTEEWWSAGTVPCPACRGTGWWRGGIVVPKVAQSKPISGIVVSIGPECVNTRIGDRVIHSRYAGNTKECAFGVFTTLDETEITDGVMKLSMVPKAQLNSSHGAKE